MALEALRRLTAKHKVIVLEGGAALVNRTLYEKFSSTTAAVSYRMVPSTASPTVEDTISEANKQGAWGYWYLSDWSFSDGFVSIFVKGPVAGGPLYGPILP